MISDNHSTRLADKFGPTLPLEQLTRELNLIYHEYEAPTYDTTHPEVFGQLPELWTQMLNAAESLMGDSAWNVLNIGCGTGFEALQLLQNCPARIQSLTCVDPSDAMLRLCRNKIARLFSSTQFLHSVSDISGTSGSNLLITNSVLHHLSDPCADLDTISPYLTSRAVWIAGHEPSGRYYRNPNCMRLFADYRRAKRRKALMSPRRILARLARAARMDDSPASLTAREAHRRKLFRKLPSTELVARLVDIHVAHSPQEVSAGRGFDLDDLQSDLNTKWKLAWSRSYNFLGSYYDQQLPDRWKTACARLERLAPRDGANFSAIWQRVS
jgi:SAM-dependent methyltransferase